MATLEATRVKCPECGATVHASEGATVLKCEYCGVESRVQRRTQYFQIPVRMEAPTAEHPQRVAVAVRTRVWPLVLILVTSIGIPITIPILIAVSKAKHWGDGITWDGNTALVADVDGDGIEDAIGLARYIQQDKLTIVALSGKDGHTLWETPSLGNYTNNYRQRISLANGTLLRHDTDQHAHVEAYDLKTGKKKWEATTSEVVQDICPGTSQADALLLTKDKKAWKLGIADGSLAPTTGPAKNECAPFPNDDHSTINRHWDRRATIEGMSIDRIVGDTTPLVAIGTKSPGTSVPMIAALDGADTVIWKSEIPGHDALQSNHRAPEYSSVSETDIALVYERESHKAPELTVFDRATGRRRFEVQLAKSGRSSNWVHSVAVGKSAAFVGIDGNLQAFELATGKRLFLVGSTN